MKKTLVVDNILIVALISLILLYIFVDKYSFYYMAIIAYGASQICFLIDKDGSKDTKTSEIEKETGTEEDIEYSKRKKLWRKIRGAILIGLMVIIIGLTVHGYFNKNW